MKNTDRLALLAWPAAAIAILAALFAGLLLLPGYLRLNPGPPPRPAAVKYAQPAAHAAGPPEDSIQIRALFASDLFASTRLSRPMAFLALSNSFSRAAAVPAAPPLYAAAAELPSGSAGLPQPTRLAAAAEADAFELPFSTRRPSAKPGRGDPQFSIELRGGLRGLEYNAGLLQNIAPLSGNMPRVMEARVSLDASGCVRQVLADAGNFEPAITRAILKKLYRARFSKNTGPCEGTVIISYPVYAAPAAPAGPNAPRAAP